MTKREPPPRRALLQLQNETSRFTYLYSATVVLLAALILIYVGQYMEMVEIQIRISELEQQARRDGEKIERLKVRKAELARLGRLEFAAQERLGLILPGQANVRYLPMGEGRGHR